MGVRAGSGPAGGEPQRQRRRRRCRRRQAPPPATLAASHWGSWCCSLSTVERHPTVESADEDAPNHHRGSPVAGERSRVCRAGGADSCRAMNAGVRIQNVRPTTEPGRRCSCWSPSEWHVCRDKLPAGAGGSSGDVYAMRDRSVRSRMGEAHTPAAGRDQPRPARPGRFLPLGCGGGGSEGPSRPRRRTDARMACTVHT